jgi:diacylglycerol kinase family enzyme
VGITEPRVSRYRRAVSTGQTDNRELMTPDDEGRRRIDGRVPVYLNVDAGPRRLEPAALARALGDDRVTVRVASRAELEAALRERLASGVKVVGIAGGDGTIHAAAAILAGSDTALLAVPTGTLNAFARRIGITSVADAAAALRAGRQAMLSIGTVQDESFLNTLTLGEYARSVRLREHRPRFIGRWPAALIAISRTLFTVESVSVELEVDGESMIRNTPFLWIGVGRGSFPKVWDSSPPVGRPELEVVVLRPVGRLEGARFLVRLARRLAFSRGPVRDRALDVLHARELRVTSPRDMEATTDGELRRFHSPVRVRLRHATLRVITGLPDCDAPSRPPNRR